MAHLSRMFRVLNIFLYLSVFLCYFTTSVSGNVELNEANWVQMLEGEWMVEFYAPWCPACNALTPAWKEMSNRAKEKKLGFKAGAIDVTSSPGLSGRFVVTALPTIYHVIEGEFRQYKGPRDVDSMVEFVELKKWKQTEALPSWKAPNSLHMGLVAQFFKLSQTLRGIHTALMDTYGLPTWGSYLIFALATIFIGALLGLVLVCVIDLLYPPRRSERVDISPLQEKKGDEKSDDEQELINDDLVDDGESPQGSDAEKNSPSDTSEDDKEKDKEAEKAGGDDKTEKQEVRKRRPRKAD